MGSYDRPSSIQLMNALDGMLCLVLMACQGTVYGAPTEKPAIHTNGARVRMRDESGFRKPISGEFLDPKPQDLVDLVRRETGQRLSLDASVFQDRPLLGHTLLRGVPAWAALENLAQNQYIKGYWTKRGGEYVLIATYSGKPPPLPPQLPPHVRAAMEKAEKGLPPVPPNPTPPAKRTQRRIWWATSSLTFTGIFIVLAFCRRKINSTTTSQEPKKP